MVKNFSAQSKQKRGLELTMYEEFSAENVKANFVCKTHALIAMTH